MSNGIQTNCGPTERAHHNQALAVCVPTGAHQQDFTLVPTAGLLLLNTADSVLCIQGLSDKDLPLSIQSEDVYMSTKDLGRA